MSQAGLPLGFSTPQSKIKAGVPAIFWNRVWRCSVPTTFLAAYRDPWAGLSGLRDLRRYVRLRLDDHASHGAHSVEGECVNEGSSNGSAVTTRQLNSWPG